MKIVILGGPITGKTTLAQQVSVELDIKNVYHTDDLKSMEWSAASEAASYWFDRPAPWIIEGVAVARALRKWLKRNPGKRLDIQIITLQRPYKPLLKGQLAMGRGVATVLREIAVELKQRGAVFVTNPTPATEKR